MTRRASVVGILALCALAAAVSLLFHERPRGGTPSDLGDRTTPETVAPTLRGAEVTAPTVAETAARLDEVPPPAADAVFLTGRVVDERSRPVPRATVLVTFESLLVSRTTTDAAGRFRLAGVSRPPEGSSSNLPIVFARDAAGHGGWTYTNVLAASATEQDVGTIVLRRAFPLTVRVTAQGAPVPGATVLVGIWQMSVGAPVLRATTDASGTARFEGLPPRTVTVAAGRPEIGGGSRLVGLPMPDDTVDVALAPPRELDVRVVEGGTGAPVAGAQVRLFRRVELASTQASVTYEPQPPTAPTGADGRTHVTGLDTATVLSVAARRADARDFHFAPDLVPSDATEVRVELPAPRSVRWHVVAGDSPVPADGTRIALRRMPGTKWPVPVAEGRMVGSDLVVDGVMDRSLLVLAVAPDGAVAKATASDRPETQPIAFHPPRKVEVVLEDDAGRGLAGWSAHLLSEWSTPLAEQVTDDAGRASYVGVEVDSVRVRAEKVDADEIDVGRADLRTGDAVLRATVSPEQEYTVRLRWRGQAILPARLRVKVDGGARVVEEDVELGQVRFRTRVAKRPLPVTFGAEGWITTGADLLPGETREVAIQRASALYVDVRRPADGRFRLRPRLWIAASRSWGNAENRIADPSEVGSTEVSGLAPGRYVVIDTASGLSSDEVVVGDEDDAPRVVLDLSQAGWAEGTLVAPDGKNLAEATVRVEATGLMAPAAVERPSAGTFRARVPGDRDAVLRVEHPTLVAAEDGGTARVRSPRSGIVLRLEEGNAATFTLSPPPREGTPGYVLLFRGPPGAGGMRRALARNGSTLSFGGFEAGRWTVWIDMQDLAPVVVPDVELGVGRTALGELAASHGSTVRCRIVGREAAKGRLLVVHAEAVDEPRYERGKSVEPAEEVVLRDLGRGRFKLTVSLLGAVGPGNEEEKILLDEVVEVDGKSTIERTIDLR